MKRADLTGQYFGKLIALHRLESGKWRCRCACGKETDCLLGNLRQGFTRSCGARGCKLPRFRPVKHGHSGKPRKRVRPTPTYSSWNAMHCRCENPNASNYRLYGALGVRVCARWSGEHGFSNFLRDMGERPPSTTLDRYPNRNGDYSPDNTRWATRKQQQRNRRCSRLLAFRGRTQTVADWSDEYGVPQNTIGLRLARGWSIEHAITVPPNSANRYQRIVVTSARA
jgi:hypothetical protein